MATEDADVDRMGEGVFVVVPQRGEPDERGLVVQHLVDDCLHRALHPGHRGGPPHPHTVDQVLGDGDPKRIGALRGLLGLLLFREQLLGFKRWLDVDPGDARAGQLLPQLEDLLRIPLLGNDREQHAEEDLPVPPVGAVLDLQRPEVHRSEDGEQVAEGGVVVELEPEAGTVHEDEIPGEPDLDLALGFEQPVGGEQQVVERLLGGGVFDRIELEAADRGIHREQQGAARVPEESVRRHLGGMRVRGFGLADHAGFSRRARLTALRTTRSLSLAERCSRSRDS